MAVRAGVGRTVLSIVAEKMTSKAFRQRTSGSRSKSVRAWKDSSGGGEYTCAIREADMLGYVPRDGKSSVVWVG